MEIWKDVEGYEGYYKVSNLGRVKSVFRVQTRNNGKSKSAKYVYKERIKKAQKQTQGYLHVCLYRDGYSKTIRLNRIVAKAFVPNPENKDQVNHINGDKTDNRACNLEWVTSSENIRHAYRTGLLKHYTRKIQMLDSDFNVVNEFESIKEASEYVGRSKGRICAACKSSVKAAGYYWRYADE